MVCSLCGGKHNLRTCPLPGANLHRQFLAEKRCSRGHAKYPQQGRKPSATWKCDLGTHGEKSFWKLFRGRQSQAWQRSPTCCKKKRTQNDWNRRRTDGSLEGAADTRFCEKTATLSAMWYSLGDPFVKKKKKHVYQRCINEQKAQCLDICSMAEPPEALLFDTNAVDAALERLHSFLQRCCSVCLCPSSPDW